MGNGTVVRGLCLGAEESQLDNGTGHEGLQQEVGHARPGLGNGDEHLWARTGGRAFPVSVADLSGFPVPGSGASAIPTSGGFPSGFVPGEELPGEVRQLFELGVPVEPGEEQASVDGSGDPRCVPHPCHHWDAEDVGHVAFAE